MKNNIKNCITENKGKEFKSTPKFTAVILAGGKSSRMGFDKQMLSLGERTIFEKNLQLLKAIFEEVLVVTNRPELYADYDVQLCSDIIPGKGPLSGIHAALKNADSEYIYVVACDMPKLNAEYIRYMKALTEKEQPTALITRFGDYMEPFCGVYSKELAPVAEECLKTGRYSAGKMLGQAETLYISEETARRFSPDWSMFENLNTRKEYERYLVG